MSLPLPFATVLKTAWRVTGKTSGHVYALVYAPTYEQALGMGIAEAARTEGDHGLAPESLLVERLLGDLR